MIEGFYYDPNHGGCFRKITKINSKQYKITGAYGDDEPETGSKWTAIATFVNKNTFNVDFSGKKHKIHGDYITKWNKNTRTLNWQDGNKWKKMYHWL